MLLHQIGAIQHLGVTYGRIPAELWCRSERRRPRSRGSIWCHSETATVHGRCLWTDLCRRDAGCLSPRRTIWGLCMQSLEIEGWKKKRFNKTVSSGRNQSAENFYLLISFRWLFCIIIAENKIEVFSIVNWGSILKSGLVGRTYFEMKTDLTSDGEDKRSVRPS